MGQLHLSHTHSALMDLKALQNWAVAAKDLLVGIHLEKLPLSRGSRAEFLALPFIL